MSPDADGVSCPSDNHHVRLLGFAAGLGVLAMLVGVYLLFPNSDERYWRATLDDTYAMAQRNRFLMREATIQLGRNPSDQRLHIVHLHLDIAQSVSSSIRDCERELAENRTARHKRTLPACCIIFLSAFGSVAALTLLAHAIKQIGPTPSPIS